MAYLGHLTVVFFHRTFFFLLHVKEEEKESV